MNDEKQTINEEVAAEAKKQLPLAVRLGIPAVLIIIVLGLVFGKSMLSPNDPAKLLSLAVLNSKDVTETDASFKMTMEMITDGEDPQEQEIAELINHISAEGLVTMNTKSVEDFIILE